MKQRDPKLLHWNALLHKTTRTVASHSISFLTRKPKPITARLDSLVAEHQPDSANSKRTSMASQTRSSPSQPTATISPSLIALICILGAVCLVVVATSAYRLCRLHRSPNPGPREDSGDIFNPNQPRTQTQVDRMKEVRWINNLYAWERELVARVECGDPLAPKPKIDERYWNDNGSIPEFGWDWGIAGTGGPYEV